MSQMHRWIFYGGRSRRTGGVTVLLADGSVRFVTESIERNTWRVLGSIADHELCPSEVVAEYRVPVKCNCVVFGV